MRKSESGYTLVELVFGLIAALITAFGVAAAVCIAKIAYSLAFG